MLDFLKINWRLILPIAAVSAILAFAGGSVAGYKVGYSFGHSDGVKDQIATAAQEALVAGIKANGKREKIENQTAKLKTPDIDAGLRKSGWMRDDTDL